MAAYVIANVNVQDAAGYEEYRKLVPATLAQYGGKFIVRGGHVERLEGEWEPVRLVVLEFESVEAAQRWYNSPEYDEAKQIRLKSALTDVLIVQGV